MKKPIELLEEELYKYYKAKRKSETAYAEGGINLPTHEQHMENLNPIIKEYKTAIRILKDNIE